MSVNVIRFNQLIGDYYKSSGDDTYYSDPEKRGKFIRYFNENGFEEDEMEKEMNETAEDCMYVEFDNDGFGFPLPQFIEDTKDTKDNKDNKMKRIEAIYEILRYMYDNNKLPSSETIEMRKWFNISLLRNVNSKDLLFYGDLYEKQVYDVFGCTSSKDKKLLHFLCVGMKEHFPFLQYITSAFIRDYVYHKIAFDDIYDDKYYISQWSQKNEFMKWLSKEDKTIFNDLITAITSYQNRINPKLRIDRLFLINDSLSETIKDIVIATKFVEQMAKSNMQTTPFQMDLMIVLKGAIKNCVSSCVSSYDSDDDDDDDIDGDDEYDKYLDYNDDDGIGVDNDLLGNIERKLDDAKCVKYQETLKQSRFNFLNTVYYNDFERNDEENECELLLLEQRKFENRFQCFRDEMAKTRSMNTYPFQSRFCCIIDRRDNNFFFFNPPKEWRDFNSTLVPEWHIAASASCLIPSIPCKYNRDKPRIEILENITTMTPCKSAKLLTLSYHILASDEIRCYLHWNAQSMRFFPKDIRFVLPHLFDLTKHKNREFMKSEEIKILVDLIQYSLPDKRFEEFSQNH